MSFSLESCLAQLSQFKIGKFETDSRKIEAGDVFICRQGLRHDSHDFVSQAQERGAIAVIAERPLNIDIPCIVTPDYTVTLSLINQYYQYPQDRLFNIGITGTNGKTTVAYSLQGLLNQTTPTAYVGTLGCISPEFEHHQVNTTPDAIALLNNMQAMVQCGVTHQVMEVSSHALCQGRVSMIDFDVVIFTNLKEDHLDYHGNRTEYIRAKMRLADHLKPGGTAIINLDDPIAPAIIERCRNRGRVVTFGRLPEATLVASDISSSCSGGRMSVRYNNEQLSVTTPLPFTFNIENSLAVLAALIVIQGNAQQAARQIENIQPVPGRCEINRLGNGATAIVDYAHNLDGLKSLLSCARSHCKGRVFTVMGVTGDRIADAEDIGALCSKLSDIIYFTSHNPLGMAPEVICQTLARQAQSGKYRIILDRTQAIHDAIAHMEADDVLLICGKGNERHQYMGPDKNQAQSYAGDRAVVHMAMGAAGQFSGNVQELHTNCG